MPSVMLKARQERGAERPNEGLSFPSQSRHSLTLAGSPARR